MEELELQFSSFLGACKNVFGPFGLILISNPPGLGMPFLDNDTCAESGGMFFISARAFFSI